MDAGFGNRGPAGAGVWRKAFAMQWPRAIEGAHDEGEDVEPRLRGIRKSSKVLKVVLLGFAVLLGAAVVLFAGLNIASCMFPGLGVSVSSDDPLSGFLSVADLCVYCAVFAIAGIVFRDISLGESPFTLKQARRIRAIAWLLLLCALTEALLPTGGIVAYQVAGGVFGTEYHTSPISTSLRIGPIIVALVFFVLSSVFKYGVTLQELSDDTV